MESWLAGGMALPPEEIVKAILSMMPPFMDGAGTGFSPSAWRFAPDDFPR